MEDYDQYTALELIQLLDVLERERFPTGGLYKRENEIMELTAKRLDIEPKEVGWLLMTNGKGKTWRKRTK